MRRHALFAFAAVGAALLAVAATAEPAQPSATSDGPTHPKPAPLAPNIPKVPLGAPAPYIGGPIFQKGPLSVPSDSSQLTDPQVLSGEYEVSMDEYDADEIAAYDKAWNERLEAQLTGKPYPGAIVDETTKTTTTTTTTSSDGAVTGEEAYEYDPALFEDPSAPHSLPAGVTALVPESGTASSTDADTYEYEITSEKSGDQLLDQAAKTNAPLFDADGKPLGRLGADGKVRPYAKDGASSGEDAYTYEYEVEVPAGSEHLSDEEIIELVKKQRAEKDAAAKAKKDAAKKDGEGEKKPASSSIDVDVKPSETVGGRGGSEGQAVVEGETALPPVEAVKPPPAGSLKEAKPAPAPATQGLSGGAKAGVAFGVLAAIALIAAGTFFALKHQGMLPAALGGGAAAGGAAGAASKARGPRTSGSGTRWSRGGAPA
jgi:hypothetical protein